MADPIYITILDRDLVGNIDINPNLNVLLRHHLNPHEIAALNSHIPVPINAFDGQQNQLFDFSLRTRLFHNVHGRNVYRTYLMGWAGFVQVRALQVGQVVCFFWIVIGHRLGLHVYTTFQRDCLLFWQRISRPNAVPRGYRTPRIPRENHNDAIGADAAPAPAPGNNNEAIADSLFQKLSNNHPSVMGFDPLMIMIDPNSEPRLPKSYDYHQMPAPFVQEFESWKNRLTEDEKQDAKGFFNMVKRRGDSILDSGLNDGNTVDTSVVHDLCTVPYCQEHETYLTKASELLHKAGDLASYPSLKRLLHSKADAFLSNDYHDLDIAWMELDVKGPQTVAFDLTSDERIVKDRGTSMVMLTNVSDAKFEHILLPIAVACIFQEQQERVDFDSFFTHTICHECCHGIGPHSIVLPNNQESTVRLELQELHSALEEVKADIVGLWTLYFFIKQGRLPRSFCESVYVSFLAGCFRSVHFGMDEAHGKGRALQFNLLLEKEAFVMHPDGRFSVNFDKAEDAVDGLSREILTIQATGDKTATSLLMDKYCKLTDPLRVALDKLESVQVPVDIITPSFPITDRSLTALKT